MKTKLYIHYYNGVRVIFDVDFANVIELPLRDLRKTINKYNDDINTGVLCKDWNKIIICLEKGTKIKEKYKCCFFFNRYKEIELAENIFVLDKTDCGNLRERLINDYPNLILRYNTLDAFIAKIDNIKLAL